MKNKKLWIAIGIVIILIILDQALKIGFKNQEMVMIPGVLKSTPVQNTGGAFGIGQNSTMTFIITNIIVLGIIIRFMIVQKEQIDKKTNIALYLVLAGGFSNLIDRIFRGYVVDFLDISPMITFPKFNLADIFIVIGFILLAAFFASYTWKEVKRKKEDERICNTRKPEGKN